MKRKEKITVDLKLQQFNPLRLKQFDTTELEMIILDDSLNVDLTNLSVYIIFTKPNRNNSNAVITNNQER